MVRKITESSDEGIWRGKEDARISSDEGNTSSGSVSPRSDSNDSDSECGYEKPTHSYVALISMAILSSENKKMMLGDIYSYIQEKYPYYKHTGDKAWRNSIRHNLSLNDCFVKAGRADNNKGHYWAIHSNCIDEFAQGDYRRRQARRRTRRRPASSATKHDNISYIEMTSVPTHVAHVSPTNSCASPTRSTYYRQRVQPYPMTTQVTSQMHTGTSPTYDPVMPYVNDAAPMLHHAFPMESYYSQMTSNLYGNWSSVPLPTYDESSCLQGISDLPSLREAVLGLSALSH